MIICERQKTELRSCFIVKNDLVKRLVTSLEPRKCLYTNVNLKSGFE